MPEWNGYVLAFHPPNMEDIATGPAAAEIFLLWAH